MRLLTGIGLLLAASAAAAAPADFGIRYAPGSAPAPPVALSGPRQVSSSSAAINLGTAVAVASRLGRVTSVVRTPARNRAVGGARNSYHLRGRALDVVPRAGVRHSDIEAALRGAGFNLVESLDEGDHSHFAFGTAPARVASFQRSAVDQQPGSRLRAVTAFQEVSR